MCAKNKLSRLLLSSLCLILLIFSVTTYGSTKLPLPTASKYLNDYIGLINDAEARQILSLGKELEDKTGAQAVIAIIQSTEGIPIETYAINLFRNWGIGQKGKDNGLLLLVAIQDKSWRVEVGRGLEGAIPDLLSSRIMESVAKPSFIEGRYSQGLISAYSLICDYIAGEYGVTLEHSLNITIPTDTGYHSNSQGGPGIFIIILILLDLIFNRGRILSALLQILFWSNLGGRHGPRGGSGRGGSGGFGGFGGGSSNGGGSSGRW